MLRLHAETIKDSRGDPTVKVFLEEGSDTVTACVPSGKSAGSREARELRDKEGRGVTRAILNIEGPIQEAIKDLPIDPARVDQVMIGLDGTPNKSKLGANATLGVSFAMRRLAAKRRGIPLWKYISEETKNAPSFPRIFVNVLNGGRHADWALPFQEYLFVIGGEPHHSIEKAQKFFATLGELVRKEYGEVPMGDEGGYAPTIRDLSKPFQLLEEATNGDPETRFAIDAAASEFFHDGRYLVGGAPMSGEELMHVYESLASRFPIISIEDPFHEFDTLDFQLMTTAFRSRGYVVTDDFTVTNPHLVDLAAREGCGNAMIVKPNQIGTLLETYHAASIARVAGWRIIVSHRSGETEDDLIADLAVGLGAFGLKAGAPTQPVRKVKYDRLLAIEKEFNLSVV